MSFGRKATKLKAQKWISGYKPKGKSIKPESCPQVRLKETASQRTILSVFVFRGGNKILPRPLMMIIIAAHEGIS
jgi:hypothetical protein